MIKTFRRIITAENLEGKSCVLSSAEPEVTVEIPNMGRFYNLWQTQTLPASIPIVEDLNMSGPPGVPRGPQDTQFRLMVIEPESRISEADKEQMVAMMEADERLVRADHSGHSTMHRTDSIDYLVMLSGEIYLKTDMEEILLRPGDFVVQGGVNHDWINRSDQPAILVGVMLSAGRNSLGQRA